jgi:putative hemolysin
MTHKHFLLVLISIGVFAIIVLFSLIDRYIPTSTIIPRPTPTITPTATETSLANPASVNCGKQGGTLKILKNGSGGEYGLCQFEDNMACEEWALYRGDCPVGGIKTTGFDTVEEKYCAWLGGQTYAVEDATCTLPSGKTCGDKELYNDSCN